MIVEVSRYTARDATHSNELRSLTQLRVRPGNRPEYLGLNQNRMPN